MSYGASLEEMRRAAQDVRKVNGDVDNQLRMLRQAVQDVKSFWRGDAAKAFDGLMDQWDQDALKLNLALNDIASNLDNMHRGYAQQEETQSAGLSKIQNELG
ncbi:WXG100 family type VII secretion target [Crossiella cryophila]|uniref:ESAT-6-like protein n=1 Tax=Crossiella cryophila TaxID=43355 RepID=A0A7W7C5Z3_9PSEU|nr:WXG100 family type VII secretion target [Crossiella cryophila]MBB4675160.1 WXG100 family type VII secretion target [Crossiella cryophila]